MEFVDENVREPILQFGAHRRVVANEVARDQQQVEEVQPSGAALQVLVNSNDRPQFVAQQRREIRACIVAKLFQPGAQLGTSAKNFLALDFAEAAAVSLPIPAPPGAKGD